MYSPGILQHGNVMLLACTWLGGRRSTEAEGRSVWAGGKFQVSKRVRLLFFRLDIKGHSWTTAGSDLSEYSRRADVLPGSWLQQAV